MLHLHCDFSLAVAVNSLTLPQEHNFESLPIWVVVDIVCQHFVNGIVFVGDVDGNFLFQINDVHLERLILFLICLQLSEQLKAGDVGFISAIFQITDIVLLLVYLRK